MAEQNPRSWIHLRERDEQQRAAVRIRVPGVHEHDRMRLIRVVPDRLVVRPDHRIPMKPGMQFDQRRRMKMPPALQLRDRVPRRIRIHRDVSEKTVRIPLQQRVDFRVAARAVVIARECRRHRQPLDVVMDHLNIERLAVTSTLACYNDCPRGNAEVDALLKRYPDRFFGYITVNPNPPGHAIAELQRWRHFHAPPLIKLHPGLHRYPVIGPNYEPIWDYANQTHAIVLVHTWDSDPNCGPLLFVALAKMYPRARILLGHSGV